MRIDRIIDRLCYLRTFATNLYTGEIIHGLDTWIAIVQVHNLMHKYMMYIVCMILMYLIVSSLSTESSCMF